MPNEKTNVIIKNAKRAFIHNTMIKQKTTSEWLTPPQLAEILNVNVSTVKRWVDKKYLVSDITPGGHRRISKNHLNDFITRYPKHAKNSYILRRYQNQKVNINPDLWKTYYSHLLKNNNGEATKIIENLYLKGMKVLDILSMVIAPTLRNIGSDWEKKNISVYEEHRMSFNIRLNLLRLDQLIPDTTKDNSNSAILACAPGEYHELPLQLVSLIYKQNGWKSHILGINIKIDELIKAAEKIKPKVINVIKTYTAEDPTAYLKKLLSYAKKYKICIGFGGGAWQKYLKNKNWIGRECARFFPALRDFSEFLKNYQRKK